MGVFIERIRRVLMSRRLILLASLAVGVAGCKSLVSVEKPLEAQDLDVPYITTPDNVVMTILNIAGVTSKDFVLDLGSGDGRIPITAAARFGARGLGVEIDPALVQLSKDNAKLAKVEKLVDFKEQDLFATDLTQASVITMYLLPDVNLKLKPALQILKPGTRIVSHDWDMGDWKPDRMEVVAAPDKKVGLIKQSKIMLWVVK
jgi:SAM-dependent methyltransferase